MATDPVCGMEIAEKSAIDHKDYEGKTYYFCSASCRDKFVAAPQQYAGRRDTAQTSGSQRASR